MKIKNANLNRALSELHLAEQALSEARQRFAVSKETYQQGALMINNARQSGNPSRHIFLDDTVTYAKEKWAQSFADLQRKQLIQKYKLGEVTKIKQEMEALSRLIEKYEKLIRQEKLQKMQSELDELIIQKLQGAHRE